jgi:hypothetical protein
MSEQWTESELAAPEDQAVFETPSTATDDDGAAFRGELVRAMRTTAAVERIKIAEDSEQRRLAQVERVRARQASEAERMRELASEDMKAIETWAAGEMKRIKLEKERRAKDLNEDLDLSLAEHGSRIDREIEGIETAIAAYLTDVDAFFDGLDQETDLVLIAKQAARRPIFPALDAVAELNAVAALEEAPADSSLPEAPVAEGEGVADEGAEEAAEPVAVGVMDPQAEPEAVESWAPAPEASPEVVPVGSSEDVESGEAVETAEPVAATASSHGSSLFESVSVMRPMSWLRRDSSDHSNSDS